ncbi:MAG: siphovirus Gp157 family protein [Mesorhizobium sp.]|nr:MAG: siphovirus Gp157 family protein [Mesorhizobium sp.]
MAKTLEVAHDLKKLEELAESGEMTPDQIADTVEGIEGTISDKLEAIWYVMQSMSANAALMKQRADEATKRAKFWGNQEAALKSYAKMIVETSGRNSIKTPLKTFALSKVGGKISVTDDKALPEEFYDLVPARVPKMDEIKKAIDEGKTIEGVSVSPEGKTLRIS